MSYTRKSGRSTRSVYQDKHRFEHWYRDNQVYFITARCRDRFAAFEDEKANLIFWDRFEHYTEAHGFTPWVTTLMNNHYHALGYLRVGEELGPMMRKIHGSVAKLVNDTLVARLVPFWGVRGLNDYFDGCIRYELQCRRAYRYTLLQAVRAGLMRDWHDYPHTHVKIELQRGVKRALEREAFLGGRAVQAIRRWTGALVRPARGGHFNAHAWESRKTWALECPRLSPRLA